MGTTIKTKKTKKVFADYASTTPVLPSVVLKMNNYFTKNFANPSSLYSEGVTAKNAITDARKVVASIVGTKPDEVVFTSGGTEAINLALIGVAKYYLNRPDMIFGCKPHIIISAIEHTAVIESLKSLENYGVSFSIVPVSKDGIVIIEDLRNMLRKETVLVSIMHANNEIGTIQPISEIGRIVEDYRKKNKIGTPYLHVDACQSPNYIPINVAGLNADMMTLDGSKIYGPKGVGALIVRKNVNILPIIYGGGQEGGLRSGTENVPLIVGFASALNFVTKDRNSESARLRTLQDFFYDEITHKIPMAKINGSVKKRLPNNINYCFPGLDSEFAVIRLDILGVSCSGASACRSLGDENFSYVVESFSPDCKKTSLRFTLGRSSTKNDIKIIIKALLQVV